MKLFSQIGLTTNSVVEYKMNLGGEFHFMVLYVNRNSELMHLHCET
jgi:hypothetical protein